MKTLLGIDIGTSSLKAMLLEVESGKSITASQSYNVDIPNAGWAEQSPDLWWNALQTVLQELREKDAAGFDCIAGIGYSGQMHGLVCLDDAGQCLRPAILWLDQRAAPQVAWMKAHFGEAYFAEQLQNPVFTGAAFPSLLWLKEHEADVFKNISTVLQPKDYLRYRMTGTLGTDDSDATGTAAFSAAKRDWAWEMIDACGVSRSMFPQSHTASALAGTITAEAARVLGLREGTPVVFGAGDQPCQSIGNGAAQEHVFTSNIGSGGQVGAYATAPKHDSQLRTQTFCHAVAGAYSVLGATLNAGMSLNWFANQVLEEANYNALSTKAAEVPAGSGGIVFLPYLTGERSPHMNANAKGMFFGLELGHDRRHMVRAVMEGVVYGLKDALATLEAMGITGDRVIASGGGAHSPLWLQIQADIFEKTVCVCDVKEQACLGACLLAGVGAGIYATIAEACAAHVKFRDVVFTPNPENVAVYRAGYETYRALYQNNKALMQPLAAKEGS